MEIKQLQLELKTHGVIKIVKSKSYSRYAAAYPYTVVVYFADGSSDYLRCRTQEIAKQTAIEMRDLALQGEEILKQWLDGFSVK